MVDRPTSAPEPADFSSCCATAGVRLEDGTYIGDARVMLTRFYEPAVASGGTPDLWPGDFWGYVEFEQAPPGHLTARIKSGAHSETMVIGRGESEPRPYQGQVREFTSRPGPPREVRVVSVFDDGDSRFLVYEAD